MVIVAHPDDAEFGAAGTVATWASEGWTIYYVVCTDASGGGPDDATDISVEAREAMTETRKREQRAACDILGVKDIIFLNYHDGLLQPTLELRRDLVRLIRQYRPSRVIFQSPDRVWEPSYSIGRHHPDHLAAGQASIAAIYPAAQNPWDFPELLIEGLQPHKVREIFVMGAPTSNYVVDITANMERKMAALRAHTSQLSEKWEYVEKMIRDRSSEVGSKNGMTYAEEFHRAENP
ncbi:MAG: PIG-L family deacetylase [Chloroflexota bacterium]|nr:PIG-L family deacetylase [Chloroflexota bacterium]